MKYAIGVDIGGTKISVVLGTERGKIISHEIIPTLKHRRTRAGVRNLVSAIEKVISFSQIKKSEILGIGIGIPGAVDSRRGVVPRSPNLKGWEDLPLRKILQKRFGLRVAMTNDANAAALGEQIFGQGRGAQNLIYLTVSTGVGGGLIINGKLAEGAAFVAGEVGHMVVAAAGQKCKCGQNGCLEAYASGTAIETYVKTNLRQKGGSEIVRLAGGGSLRGSIIGKAAQLKNPLALEAYRRAAFYLGTGIGSLLNLLNPEKVILGGGVWKSAPKEFLSWTLQSCKRNSWEDAYRSVKITKTKLGDHVGNLGALALVFSNFRKPK